LLGLLGFLDVTFVISLLAAIILDRKNPCKERNKQNAHVPPVSLHEYQKDSKNEGGRPTQGMDETRDDSRVVKMSN